MKMRFLVSLFSIAGLVGCGSQVIVGSGGGDGTGGTGGGTAGTTGTMSTTSTTTPLPPECAVQTNQAPPYATLIHFEYPSDQVVYLRQTCYIEFAIVSCADGYKEPLSLYGDCTLDCTDFPNDCIACEPCPEEALPITAGAPANANWSGNTYTFGQNTIGCTCHNEFVAPAGKYRIRVPVYLSPEDVISGNAAWVAEQEFELPAPNGAIEVPVISPL